MGIKYHFEVKDQKLDRRFKRQHADAAPTATTPGQRAPKKLTKKQAARLASNPPASAD